MYNPHNNKKAPIENNNSASKNDSVSHDHDSKKDDTHDDFDSEQDNINYDNNSKDNDADEGLKENDAYDLLSSDEDGSLNQQNKREIYNEIFCCVCNLHCSGHHQCVICKQFAHTICGTTQGEEGCGSSIICNRCGIQKTIKENTSVQAERMLKRSNKKFCEVSIDDNVVIPIPSVDKAKCEFSNLIGIVLDKEEDMYVLGCRAGWLKHKFARNKFEKCSSNFLTLLDVPKRWVEVRAAATLVSVDGKAQGNMKCNCKKSCSIGRCKCKKLNLYCNSKCHQSGSCDNK